MENKPYVSIQRWGNCRLCGAYQDLRMDVCFTCSPFVAGERISATTHKLWDSKNPTNVWYYSELGH